jgi:ABC-type glycerol-3-phosphate transport system permease component
MKMPKERTVERIVGYALLIMGLVLVILPVYLAISIFLSGSQVPQLISTPATSEAEFARAATTFSNVCLVFFLFMIMAWAGSIISSRGVTMIKDVKLKFVRKSLGKAAEAIKSQDVE